MKRALLATAAALTIAVGTTAAFAQSGGGEMRGPGAAQQQLNNKEQDQGIKSGQMSPGGGANDEINRGKTGTEKQGTKPNAQPSTAQQDQKPGMQDKRSTQNENAKPSTAQKENSGTNERRSTETNKSTTSGSAKSVELSHDQRTKIHQTIINKKVERLSNVNFSVSVGTRVPRTVRYYPLPVEVIAIVPEYRGYDYFVVGDEIVIIDPRTLEIVAVLPA